MPLQAERVVTTAPDTVVGRTAEVPGTGEVRFRRHGSGDRRERNRAPDHQRGQGPAGDVPSVHRRPGYPLTGCAPAEPASVSPGGKKVTRREAGPQGQPAGPKPRVAAEWVIWQRTPS